MEPEQTTTPEEEITGEHLSHTYQDDMSKAMNATDVKEVQSMLTQAREQEAESTMIVTEQKEKSWYSVSSFILVVLTLAVLGYGTYYYMHLTVPVQPAVSVGVFPNTDPIVASSTTVGETLATLRTSTTLPIGRPVLVNLVTDTQSNTPLTNTQLYTFIGADLSTPLQDAIMSAKLGIVNTGKDILPFVVISVPDPEKASNALSSEEPTLMSEFAKVFSPAETAVVPASAGNTQQSALSALVASQSTPQVTPVQVTSNAFQSQYFYNLPVRSLTETDPKSGQQRIIFLYGYATNNVVVITSTPEVLKAVYDTVIAQH
jgi:hypothetical protein